MLHGWWTDKRHRQHRTVFLLGIWTHDCCVRFQHIWQRTCNLNTEDSDRPGCCYIDLFHWGRSNMLKKNKMVHFRLCRFSSLETIINFSLDIPLVNLCLDNIKIEWVMTLLWRHLSFLQTIVHISKSIKPTNFVLGTNTHQHNVHLMMKMKMTLTDDEGHRRRSKVTKMN